MNLLAFFRKNILLFVFFIVSLWYGYSNITGDIGYQYLLKPFMVSSLLVHYLITAKQKNIYFITALIFALAADLLFNITIEETFMYGMAGFLMFNLFMMIIVAEKAGEIKLSNFFLSMVPFLLILYIVIYYLFSSSGEMTALLTIYGVMLVFLCSFSLYYYIKTRSKVSLYFLTGAILFVLAGIAKGVKEFIGVTLSMEIMNNLAYTLSLYFYYRALVAKQVVIDNSDLQSKSLFN